MGHCKKDEEKASEQQQQQRKHRSALRALKKPSCYEGLIKKNYNWDANQYFFKFLILSKLFHQIS